MMRAEFRRPVSGPILSRRFTCKLDDGWYLVVRGTNEYHCFPLAGWRVGWWRFRVLIEATWNGFGTIRWP